MATTGNFHSKSFPAQLNLKAPLHTVFEGIAASHPDRNAVYFAEQHLTYRELNEKANELAHWLIARGIRAESRVAVCLKPSFDIIIALLAIQKAGGVYLPIDPDYPQQRIGTIANDAAIALTITQEDLREKLGEVLVRPYTLKQTKYISDIPRRNNPQVEIEAKDTAYIFYTSGTTGKPKGIAISYRGFAYYVSSAIDRFGMNSQDTILTIAKFSFSISLFDLMTGIISGGQLMILPRNEIMDYRSLVTALERTTVAHMSPNLLKGLVRYLRHNYSTYRRFAGLRHISSGGDLVPGELLEELKIVFPEAEIYVIYGCTEIACMGCYYEASRDRTVAKSYIGQAFPGTEIILLNDADRILTNDEIGEICVRSPGVMKGYLNREQLNKQAFIKIEGLTYFKTGDLARRNSSGNLEYLGRRDFQIKLRGQRIELVEVESHLRQAPKVRDAVVAVDRLGTGNKRLIAYLTLEDVNNFSLAAIRAYLQARLPDYMQPSGWVILDEMPLNENLKIARKALPPATLENSIVTEAYVSPRNETEKKLAEIWQDVLDLPQVGINDNFFQIGGDSLSAMNICMLAAEAGIEISPSQMAENPTIARLSEIGIQAHRAVARSQKSSSGSIPELPPFILQFLYERGTQTPHHWNISRIVVAKEHLVWQAVEQAFYYLGDRHDALRLRFELNGDRWQARVLPNCQETIACQRVDLSHVAENEREQTVAEITQACQKKIDLTQGPIAYLVLFEFGQERSPELFFVVHHFAMDVISWKIFWLEFELVYHKLVSGGVGRLSTSPTSFRTWTQRLREYANSATVEADICQWREHSWSQVAKLPRDIGDRTRANTNDSARVVRFALSQWQTETLMQSGTRQIDVESILISSLAAALSRWQNSSFAYLDRLVHGRNVGLSEADLNQTLGCLISYAPTLLKINPEAPEIDLLTDIARQMERQKYSATSIDLYRYLGSNSSLVKSLEKLPRAEVLFNYRGKVDDILERSKIFAGTRAIAGSDHNPQGLRQYPLAIAIDIIDRQLEVRCVYSKNIHQRESIERLCGEFSEGIFKIQQGIAEFPRLKIT